MSDHYHGTVVTNRPCQKPPAGKKLLGNHTRSKICHCGRPADSGRKIGNDFVCLRCWNLARHWNEDRENPDNLFSDRFVRHPKAQPWAVWAFQP